MNSEQAFSAEFADDLPLDVEAICQRMNELGIYVTIDNIVGEDDSDFIRNVASFADQYDGDVNEFFEALGISVTLRRDIS